MAGLDWESDLSFAPLFDDISKDAGIPPIQNAASSVSQPPAPTATNDNAISDGAIGETEHVTVPNEIVIANGTVDAQTFGSNTDTAETSDDAEDVAFQPAPNGEVVLTLRTKTAISQTMVRHFPDMIPVLKSNISPLIKCAFIVLIYIFSCNSMPIKLKLSHA